MTKYPTVQEIIDINEDQVALSGEPHAVTRPNELESAVGRPASGYYDDLIAEAAALWESLAGNHPFMNGNKRTAFAAAHVFLKSNGINITATEDEVVEFIAERYSTDPHTMDFENLDAWLRANSRESK